MDEFPFTETIQIQLLGLPPMAMETKKKNAEIPTSNGMNDQDIDNLPSEEDVFLSNGWAQVQQSQALSFRWPSKKRSFGWKVEGLLLNVDWGFHDLGD